MNEYELATKAFGETPAFENTLLNFDTPDLWYQYRSFEGFWSIIKSDSLWATDARFSNDTAEQRFAADILRHGPNGLRAEFNEDYIVCLCSKDDKLSQWRGYAPNGGVSMGFDFSATVPFYIPLANKALEYNMDSGNYKNCFVQLGKVSYVSPPDGEADDAYYRKCYDKISGISNIDKLNESGQEYDKDFKKRVTFVKHGGFAEEEEWRLVFHNEDGMLSKCVRYKDPGADGVRRPYIVVRPGKPEYNSSSCVVRLCLSDQGVTNKLIAAVQKELPLIKIDDCKNIGKPDKTDNFCFGCTRRGWKNIFTVNKSCRYMFETPGEYEWGLRGNENSIIVSQGDNQEEIFNAVHKLVSNLKKCNVIGAENIKVWCEGHLPIRSLTVGPCLRQEEIEESIRHYCSHTYWLRDVDIKSSKIPFRRTQ